jgi:DUF971 family protein
MLSFRVPVSAVEKVEVIGKELAIVWSDGTESYLALDLLRRRCPCALCAGEKDIFGNVYGGKAKLVDNSFELAGLELVGGYAIRPRWRDGHESGIYSFPYLRELASVS